MTATVYECEHGHTSVSPTTLAKCPHMVDGKPCTSTPVPKNTHPARVLGGF